eukprot:7267121-Pyramimonas_sp.AAC.1
MYHTAGEIRGGRVEIRGGRAGFRVGRKEYGQVKTPRGLTIDYRPRKSGCTVRKGGYSICLIATVTSDSDIQESQELVPVCCKRGLVPRTYP